MINFRNAGVIDLLAVSTFGVSVKPTDNPIGFFGTGLKYALAVLMRTGHRVQILAGEEVIEVVTRPQTVRGVQFDLVHMVRGGVDAPLGFTTELGKQWKVWMAYRELACNAKDEGGQVESLDYMPDPEADATQIVVHGEEIEAVYLQRGQYLLDEAGAREFDRVKVLPGGGNALFFRGVRVHEFQRPALHTYSIQSKVELTEDRTLKSGWDATHAVARCILRSTDEDFIRTCITAPESTYEGSLDMHGWSITPSPEFLKVVGECAGDRLLKVNDTALKVFKENTRAAFAPTPIELTDVERAMLQRALTFCRGIGFPIEGSYPIVFVETLGSGGLGAAVDQTIYVARRTLELGGTKQLASTLIEEYLHLRHNYYDMTRELQSFLFDKVVSLGEQLVGEPL